MRTLVLDPGSLMSSLFSMFRFHFCDSMNIEKVINHLKVVVDRESNVESKNRVCKSSVP